MKKHNVSSDAIERECRRMVKKYGIERVEKMIKKLEERENYEACSVYLRVINEVKNEKLKAEVG